MKKITLNIDYGADSVLKRGFGAYLKEKYRQSGYDLGTQMTHPPAESEFVIYMDMPTIKPPKEQISYVILAEPPVIFSRNYKVKNFKHFKKVFTWHDGLVNNENIIKFNYYAQEPKEIDFDISKKINFCALVAKNKHSRRKKELFSERAKAIRWFEKNAAHELDLYGREWELGIIKHFGPFDIKTPAPNNYKGPLANKEEVLKTYKFSIAYENWENNAGYITEKIFDCFSASNVPVYFGAKNITQYIPKECFIDKRDFKNYEELYKYMKNMYNSVYIEYLKNIEKFYKSEKMQKFSYEYCANILVKETLG